MGWIMDKGPLAEWMAAGVAAVATMIVIFQAAVQRRQRDLQEVEAHKQQAEAWRGLADSWETALLAAVGHRAVSEFGVPEAKANAYFEAVEQTRQASIAWLLPVEPDKVAPSEWDRLSAETDVATEKL